MERDLDWQRYRRLSFCRDASVNDTLQRAAFEIARGKLAARAYVDETARRVAHVTLDDCAANLATSIGSWERTFNRIEFLAACGPCYVRPAPCSCGCY